jgi:hypothetical protein
LGDGDLFGGIADRVCEVVPTDGGCWWMWVTLLEGRPPVLHDTSDRRLLDRAHGEWDKDERIIHLEPLQGCASNDVKCMGFWCVNSQSRSGRVLGALFTPNGLQVFTAVGLSLAASEAGPEQIISKVA